MQFHHIGLATKDIDMELKNLSKIYDIKEVSETVFDEQQDAHLCMVKTNNGINIELISGPIVNEILKKGLSYYHIAFLVDDIDKSITLLQGSGALLVSDRKPASLFNNKPVAFLLTKSGLIELVEG